MCFFVLLYFVVFVWGYGSNGYCYEIFGRSGCGVSGEECYIVCLSKEIILIVGSVVEVFVMV